MDWSDQFVISEYPEAVSTAGQPQPEEGETSSYYSYPTYSSYTYPTYTYTTGGPSGGGAGAGGGGGGLYDDTDLTSRQVSVVTEM